MKLFYGNFPALEDKFIDFVRVNRKNRLDKWLVICASSLMAQALQKRLVREMGALANMYFISVGGLIARLDEEAGGKQLPLLPQDKFRDFIIKAILEEPDLKRHDISRGLLQAVKSSLRDLADSCVPAERLQEFQSTMADEVLVQDAERFNWLVRLCARYEERENQISGFRPYGQMYARALEQVDVSPYLHDFSQVIIYGFYDLTGRQWDLISRVRSCCEGAVFAPYEKHPAFKFAERFFTTNWLGSGEAEPLPPAYGAMGQSAAYLFSPQGSAPAPNVHFVNAFNVEGELFAAAKEILRLHTEQGVAFEDIGVICRSAAAYQDPLRRIFKQNCIPLDASFTYPLSAYALGRFCLGLFALASRQFAREEVLAVVSSVYFASPKKNAWTDLIRNSLVQRDLNQWRDLLPSMRDYDADFMVWLETLGARLEKLKRVQSWQDGARLACQLLEEQVDKTAFEGKDAEIYQKVQEKLQNLALYQQVRATSKYGEIPLEIRDALGSLSFNETERSAHGVTFTDALRARGLQFRTTFLLGLNAKDFPQLMPQDPILRDSYRQIIREHLGYWINDSLDRTSEEKILFYTALTGAREALYISFARQHADGKPAVASIYLAEAARACKVDLNGPSVRHISGRLHEQLCSVPCAYLSGKEISRAFALDLPSARRNYKQAGLLGTQQGSALSAAAALRAQGGLGAFDGVIRSGEALFARINESGFSPSALQTLAQCPLRYFFDRGLKLGQEEEPLSRQELAPNLRGNIYHEVLRKFYETLQARNLTHELFESGAKQILEETLAALYTKQSYRTFGLYPLVWEFILEDIRAQLDAFVPEDLNELGGFTPRNFEVPVVCGPDGDIPLRLHGFVDRIDTDDTQKCWRVIDYKSSDKAKEDLAETFFQAGIFQPFLYVFMVLQSGLWKDYRPAGSALLSIKGGYKKREYPFSAYQAAAPQVYRFLRQITDYIRQGTFFMVPSSGNCQYCPYGQMCRKDDSAAKLRASKSAPCRALEESRQ